MCLNMFPKTMKIKFWRGSGRSWKRSWHENRLAGCLCRFWQILDRRGMPKMAARWPNLAPRWGQDDAKMFQVGERFLAAKLTQDGHLGPNLEALGAILAPTWRHLAPFGRDFGRSEPGQNSPKSAKTAFDRIFVPSSLP